ncbi:DNA polymerase III subunit gamma/tau [Olsenella sp. HMSC062G07]|uniref:DNA polymerase III subunit gamma/tau n=1 Tax=Olsenella sp. HMSC062G07 TaxID=1739330 RepID=UPI0008A5FBCB|nr:DNA polymerase III subunit gamma/tau [Olsenella sp. HMSC062G07]OFK22197.1 hypothetical protein HMPREF2826_02585 [Olsenella sp. HMSC062G07]
MESLYRKYRPQTFADVVGQQHVVSTLEHAVLEGRISHAYLFCGPRGTGKTTMARILAKALICERGAGHLPDGSCEQCRLIAAGEHPDVLELDAASRTGVDNVREEIINRVAFAPVRGRYKAYVIDEVHMLTTAAFNALLKTLEEPPPHVVFVLCTTDPQKVPETILSRVQRFDFRPIGHDAILAHLKEVCGSEGFDYDEAALDLVVRHARGGMRDALSTLEQLSTFGGGNVSLDAARDLLGEVTTSQLVELSCAIARRDVPGIFDKVSRLVDDGRDLLQFSRELAAHLRDVYVVSVAGPDALALDLDDEGRAQRHDEALAFGSPDCVAHALAVLNDASNEMRVATNQRLTLEVALTRIARPRADLTLEALADQLAQLEGTVVALSARLRDAGASDGGADASAVERGGMTAPSPARAAPAASRTAESAPAPPRAVGAPSSSDQPAPGTPAPVPTDRPDVPPAPVSPPPAASPERAAVTDAGELQRRWRQVVDVLLRTNPSRASLLRASVAREDTGGRLLIQLPKGSSFVMNMLERTDVRQGVDEAVASVFGARQLVYVEARSAGLGLAPTARGASSPSARPAPASDDRPRPDAPRPVTDAPSVPPLAPSTPAGPVTPARTAPDSAGQAQAPAYEEVPLESYGEVPFEEGPPREPSPPTSFAPASQATRPCPDERETPATAQAQTQTYAPDGAPVSSRAAGAPSSSSQPAAGAPTPAPQATSSTPDGMEGLLAMLTEVFGEGVTVSVEKPGGEDGAMGRTRRE